MSTILDSLKKSSEKRGNGTGSSINNFSFSSGNNSRFSNGFVLIIIFLISVFSVYYFFYWDSGDENTTEKEESKRQLVENNKQVKPTDRKKQNNSERMNNQSEAKKVSRPDTIEVKDRLKTAGSIRSENITNQPKKGNPDENKKRNAAQNPVSVKQVSGKTEKGDTKINPVKLSEDNKSAVVSSKNKVVKNNNPQEVQVQKYQYLYQLPFSIRKEIPKIKLNIHVFDQKEENRVVVINGEAFAIGDTIEDLVLIYDIIPEGLVLDYNGTKFLIPKL